MICIFLTKLVNKTKLLKYIEILILDDEKTREKSVEEIFERLQKTFMNSTFLNNLNSSNKNWVDEDNEVVIRSLLKFIKGFTKTKSNLIL